IILTMEDGATPAEAAVRDQALMQPIQTISVAYKVVCFQLPPLQPLDAAMLFARRVHRPLYESDIRITTQAMLEEFDAAGGGRIGNDARVLRLNDSESEGLSNLARLAKHPVLVRLRGNPGRIIEVLTRPVHPHHLLGRCRLHSVRLRHWWGRRLQRYCISCLP
ncbi:hypothetical protein FOZ63_013145, partial [Perkinsus olseni]